MKGAVWAAVTERAVLLQCKDRLQLGNSKLSIAFEIEYLLNNQLYSIIAPDRLLLIGLNKFNEEKEQLALLDRL